jgi:hypothetical protein
MSKGLMVWASEVVSIVASEYNLDKEKCMSLIESTWETGVSGSGSAIMRKSSSVSSKVKKLIPLPFNRETVDLNGCHGLNYNHGLFTQCQNKKLEEETYCNSCKTETETSSSGKPVCGTIEDRTDAEFKDSENRKPVHYLSVLRKLRVKPEAAIEEAGKQNIIIDSFHLQDLPKPVKVVKEKVIKEKPVKEPKPVKEKPVKEVKEKVIKEKPVKEVKEKVIKEKPVKEKKEAVGRPKSTKKPIETAAVEDLFASLVAEEISNASGSESEVEVEVEVNKVEVKKVDKKTELNSEKQERAAMQNEEKEQKLKDAASAKEKKLKDAAEAKEKKLKDAADAKEKKAAEVAAAKLEKEAAAAKEKEKKAEEAAAAKEKKLKDAAVAKLEKEAAASKEKKAEAVASKKANEVSVIQEPVAPVEVTKVTVKRITIDGKEYLKSSTNMLYDPKTKDEVGIYNTETGGIDALPEESDDEEEVEDDYDSEDN